MNINVQDKKIIKQKIWDIFAQNHLRVTDARRAIIDVLLKGCHHSHTINAIREHLKNSSIKITVASIYNNLALLNDLGIIMGYYNFAENEVAFELNVLNEKIHVHFYDVDKKKYVYVGDSPEVINLLNERCASLGYDLTVGIITLHVKKHMDNPKDNKATLVTSNNSTNQDNVPNQ